MTSRPGKQLSAGSPGWAASLWLPLLAGAPAQAAASQSAGETLPPGVQIEYALVRFALWLLAAMLAGKLLLVVWDFILLPIARRTRTTLDVRLLDAARKPAAFVLLMIVLRLGTALSAGDLPLITAHPGWAIYNGILYAGLVLSITALVYTAAKAVAEWYGESFAARTASRLDDQFITLFRRVAKFLFLFLAVMIILDHFGIRITALLATAGVASLAVAFAAQETLANMIAGFVLMIDRPFVAGDRIQLPSGVTGDVMDIGLRSTKVLSFDNTVISVPNSEIAKSQIINQSAPDPKVKIRQTLGVAYGTDLRKVKSILHGIMSSHPDILKEPPPSVYFSEFGESSLNLLFVCWVADYREKFRILDEVNMAIKDEFESERIEIPFPQRDVRLHLVGESLSGSDSPAAQRCDTGQFPAGPVAKSDGD